MSKTDHLIEQHILRHEAQLKHLDELFERAHQATEAQEEPDPLLAALQEERNQLAHLLSSMRGEISEDWKEVAEKSFGPLAIWEVMARLVERSIERLENRGKD